MSMLSCLPHSGTEVYVLDTFLGIIIQCKVKTCRLARAHLPVLCEPHATQARPSLSCTRVSAQNRQGSHKSWKGLGPAQS